MRSCKPVSITRGAFAFCRYTLAILLWVALIMGLKWLVIVTAAILALSALLTVRRAPLVVLYTVTVERLFPSGVEVLDEHAMRFAHTFGVLLLGIALGLLYYPPTVRAGWIFLLLVALAKTVGALGFCAAGRMYTCMANSHGSCCGFLRKRKDQQV